MARLAITVATPAPPGSRAGNRATAERWARLLRDNGCAVTIIHSNEVPHQTDLLIALHAWRSHELVKTFRTANPHTPIIVVLTGTDIYRFQHSHPQETLKSMALADSLIGLHDQVANTIPDNLHHKLYRVFQSATPVDRSPTDSNYFDICIIGHLREEKDPLCGAAAARRLPQSSRVRVLHAGGAYDNTWRKAATREMSENTRYHWLGEIPRTEVQRLMAHSQLMVVSSIMEGGANVISEACMAGLPIIASDIPGNRGLLGYDYPGYYPVTNVSALSQHLQRAEDDSSYLASLAAACRQKARDFHPDVEASQLLSAVHQTLKKASQ